MPLDIGGVLTTGSSNTCGHCKPTQFQPTVGFRQLLETNETNKHKCRRRESQIQVESRRYPQTKDALQHLLQHFTQHVCLQLRLSESSTDQLSPQKALHSSTNQAKQPYSFVLVNAKRLDTILASWGCMFFGTKAVARAAAQLQQLLQLQQLQLQTTSCNPSPLLRTSSHPQSNSQVPSISSHRDLVSFVFESSADGTARLDDAHLRCSPGSSGLESCGRNSSCLANRK